MTRKLKRKITSIKAELIPYIIEMDPKGKYGIDLLIHEDPCDPIIQVLAKSRDIDTVWAPNVRSELESESKCSDYAKKCIRALIVFQNFYDNSDFEDITLYNSHFCDNPKCDRCKNRIVEDIFGDCCDHGRCYNICLDCAKRFKGGAIC